MMKTEALDHVIDVLNTKEPTARNFEEVFQPFGYTVEHENKILFQTQGINNGFFNLQNSFVVVVENRLMKVTEICLGNRIVRIIDSFTCIPPPHYQQQSPGEFKIKEQEQSPAKLQIKKQEQSHAEPQIKEHEQSPAEPQIIEQEELEYVPYQKFLKRKYNRTEEFNIRDTKNLVKNVFKLFQRWVGQLDSSYNELRETLKKCMRRNPRFNNRLIVSLSKDTELREAFKTFCSNFGEEYINSSRIVDKVSHIQALRNYLKLCLRAEHTFSGSQSEIGKRGAQMSA